MIRAISLGGGVQSTALCVLATQGVIEADVAIFSNVGRNAENPVTLEYVEMLLPWLNERGLEAVERYWIASNGHKRDLYDDVMSDARTVPIPIRFDWGGFGSRKCTDRYKIRVVGRELALRGATRDDPAEVMIGISTDEYHRANRARAREWETVRFPLLELGYSRTDCERIVAEAGLPIPPKSACWFCPFKGPKRWAEMRRDDPERFQTAIEMERHINEVRVKIGRDEVYMGAPGVLLENMPPDQGDVPDPEEGKCDSGYCWV